MCVAFIKHNMLTPTQKELLLVLDFKAVCVGFCRGTLLLGKTSPSGTTCRARAFFWDQRVDRFEPFGFWMRSHGYRVPQTGRLEHRQTSHCTIHKAF